MSTVKKGVLTKANEWRVHLRRDKRFFWRRERRKAHEEALKEAHAPLLPA